MKILLDHCVPKCLKREIVGHEVFRAIEMGWDGLQNGLLLDAAENANFDVLLTVDRSIPHQQQLRDRKLALVIMVSESSNKWNNCCCSCLMFSSYCRPCKWVRFTK